MRDQEYASSSVISRDMNAGDSIAWLHVLDPDNVDQFTFSFAVGDGDTDNDKFEISSVLVHSISFLANLGRQSGYGACCPAQTTHKLHIK